MRSCNISFKSACNRMETLTINGFFISGSFLLTAFAIAFYLCLKYTVYNVWIRKGVPHSQPSIPFGNITISYFQGKTLLGTIVTENYMKFRKSPFSGLYILWEPILLINDPELIRLVFVKNFTNFCNRGRFIDENKDPLSASLDRMNDEKWKRLRGKLSPAFSSGKLKLMYPLVEEICYNLVSTIDKALLKHDEIDFKELTTRYTVDCISSIAYGVNADSLHNTDSLFLKYGKSSFHIGRVFLLCSFFIPQLFRFIPVPARRKRIEKFFIDFFVNMVEHRRVDKESRIDVLNMIIKLVDYGTIDSDDIDSPNKNADKLTMMEGVAQAFVFFAAGQETTSSLITCCLYELSLNPDIQQQLFIEIHEVQNSSGGLDYDKLFEMKYLDLVVQETLRKYPAVAFLTRICTEDFKVPNSKLTINKGTRIFIPIEGLQMDPDIYPEPERFDPARFTPENKAKRHNFTYLPFGDGPRQCIAKRLGILKAKIAIFNLLLNYVFLPCEKMPDSIKFLPGYVGYVPADVTLKVERRKLQNDNVM